MAKEKTRKVKKSTEDQLREMGLHQININELLYPKDENKAKVKEKNNGFYKHMS